MAEYRAYVIGSDGHFVQSKPLICEKDDEAIKQAKAELPDRTIEIWSGDRFVIRIDFKP